MKGRAIIVGVVSLLVGACALVGTRVFAYERIYRPTPSGDIEIKDLPDRLAMSSAGKPSYFQCDDELFMRLFEYIKENDIAMTVPVEAEIDSAEMRFFVGTDRRMDPLPSRGPVTVSTLPARRVVSIGIRGAYTEANFHRARSHLEEWFEMHPEWRATAPPYAVYWDGPYLPAPLRRSEVHIPIAHSDPGPAGGERAR